MIQLHQASLCDGWYVTQNTPKAFTPLPVTTTDKGPERERGIEGEGGRREGATLTSILKKDYAKKLPYKSKATIG